MSRDQTKQADTDEPQTALEPAQGQAPEHPDTIVTAYRVTVKLGMTATVTMELDTPDGRVELNAQLDARDVRGRITRQVTIDGPRVSITLIEDDLPDWKPGNPDVARSARALRAEANTRYINRAKDWYALYQHMVPDADADAPGVPTK